MIQKKMFGHKISIEHIVSPSVSETEEFVAKYLPVTVSWLIGQLVRKKFDIFDKRLKTANIIVNEISM